jgi:hypothetical protein|tara:strand:- start:132 stop:425 length:294 start_codon:yes stop_codon:yes gene_type:complete
MKKNLLNSYKCQYYIEKIKQGCGERAYCLRVAKEYQRDATYIRKIEGKNSDYFHKTQMVVTYRTLVKDWNNLIDRFCSHLEDEIKWHYNLNRTEQVA